jgi:hypothetical protein
MKKLGLKFAQNFALHESLKKAFEKKRKDFFEAKLTKNDLQKKNSLKQQTEKTSQISQKEKIRKSLKQKNSIFE